MAKKNSSISLTPKEEKTSNDEEQFTDNGLISLRSRPPSFVYNLLVEDEDGKGGQQILILENDDPMTAAVEMSSGSSAAAAVTAAPTTAGLVPTCICSSTSQLLTAAGMDGIPPAKTPANSGPDANFLADSLGVSPLYRQEDTKRWQTAAKVYQSSRSQMHSPTSGTCAPQHFHFGESLTAEANLTQKIRQCRSSGSPISLEDIASVNRQFHRQMECGQRRRTNDAALNGSLELEAIAAVHELASQVKQISVSEILPRTSDLIFLNIKTYEELPYTLELTMKGWRVCSMHTDCMNGDYHNVALHTRYFQNAKDMLKVISPDHDKHFTDCLAQRLSQLQRTSSSAHVHDNHGRNVGKIFVLFQRKILLMAFVFWDKFWSRYLKKTGLQISVKIPSLVIVLSNFMVTQKYT